MIKNKTLSPFVTSNWRLETFFHISHRSPCNVCRRSVFHSTRSSRPIGRPDSSPANSQWRGSSPRTAEPPTAAPGSRLSPPWTPGHMGNLSEQTSVRETDEGQAPVVVLNRMGSRRSNSGDTKKNKTKQTFIYTVYLQYIPWVTIAKQAKRASEATAGCDNKNKQEAGVKSKWLSFNPPPLTSRRHEVHSLNDFRSLLNY